MIYLDAKQARLSPQGELPMNPRKPRKSKNLSHVLWLITVGAVGIGMGSCGSQSDGGAGGATASAGGSAGGAGRAATGGQSGASAGTGGSAGVTASGGVHGSGGATASGGAVGTGGATGMGAGGIASGSGGRKGSGGTTGADAALDSGDSAGSGGTVTGSGGKTTAGTGGKAGAAGPADADDAGQNPKGPCDIYNETDGHPCVAAHSTVRLLLSTYTGALYQVRKGGSASGTGGTTQDIGIVASGFADSSAQDTFCGSSTCTISKIYDQSGNGNHLTVAPAGGAKKTADNEADATARPITIQGRKVYGEDGKVGVGYRNNKTKGTATGDNAETEYAIFDATVFNSGCCFDYGNMETDTMDDGEGTMEAIYWGNSTAWGKGAGNGPWVMGDLENGLWAGNVSPYSGNTSITGYKYVTAMVKGDAAGKNHWAIKAGNAQAGKLTKMFDGQRPSSRYNPMKKQGAIGLNIGGDNSNSAIGVFFEGVMTAHYSSDAADDAVQANIVSIYGP